MGVKYSKPCGAIADAKELEYISALLQTERLELRKDGSIQAIDIASFLISRYGIQISEEEVKESILRDFGQCPQQSDVDENYHANEDSCVDQEESSSANKHEEHLDLTQVLALLLIPSLLRAKATIGDSYQRKRVNCAKVEQSKRRHSSSSLNPFRTTIHESIPPTPENISNSSANLQEKAVNNDNSVAASNSSTSLKCISVNQSEKGCTYSPYSDLIENVLEMMLHDAIGASTPQPLTTELVRQLLMFYGEDDMARNDALLQEMVDVASKGDEDVEERHSIILDKNTFAIALTSDVELYNLENEDSVSTNYHDIFHVPVDNDNCGKPSEEDIQAVQTVFTFPSIDYTADTFRSKSFVILLWVTWILSYFAYLFNSSGFLALGMLDCENSLNNQFGCWVAQGIIDWLIIMVQLSVLGSTFVLWASIGNGNKNNPFYAIISMGAIFLFAILPFFFEFQVARENNEVIISTMKDSTATQQLLYILSMLGGFLLLLSELRILVQIMIPQKLWERYAFLRRFLTSGVIQMEAKAKKASSYKLNRLISNAYAMHDNSLGIAGNSETTFGRALMCFSKSYDSMESVGGPFWMWKKIVKQEIFEEEGVWLTTHLLAGSLSQLTICLFLVSFFIYIYQSEWFQGLVKYLPEGQKWRLDAALIYGLVWAEGATLINTFYYIPSTIRTILQFRSGAIPSLHDPTFLKYRLAVDQSSLLFGTIFWGTLYTAVLIGVCAMLFLGVCLWPDFAQVLTILWASFIGFLLTVLIKWILLVLLRRSYHRAFFRTKPALANFVGVILESWSLGLTTGHMIFRTLRLLFAASFFIGRVDTPLLTEEACFLGPLEIDGYPLIFRKDLLSHEAHRHPYIERLGVMYMMKLRHGKRFGSYPGTCWRLLFTFALMPWMRKYRLSSDNIEITNFRFATARMWTGRLPKEASPQALNGTDSDEEGTDLKELKKELTRLKRENEMLRHAIYQPNNYATPNAASHYRSHLSLSMPTVFGEHKLCREY